jgi:hypothetical protein
MQPRSLTPRLLRAVLASAGLVLALAWSGPAAAYSCGNPSSDHCYGVTSWTEQPQYFGAYTDAKQVAMACPSSCGGFVDDEIWLVDDNSSGCTANSFQMCWMEAGTLMTAGANHPQFFWAESKPAGGSGFTLHIVGNADAAGTVDHYMIIKDGRQHTSNLFQVWIYNTSLSTLYHGTSTGNAMSGERILLGQELAGSSGASAGTAHFTRNIWAVQVLGPEYVFWYNRQVHDGGVSSDNPPFASWAVHPSSPPPPEGGDFTTHCCS